MGSQVCPRKSNERGCRAAKSYQNPRLAGLIFWIADDRFGCFNSSALRKNEIHLGFLLEATSPPWRQSGTRGSRHTPSARCCDITLDEDRLAQFCPCLSMTTQLDLLGVDLPATAIKSRVLNFVDRAFSVGIELELYITPRVRVVQDLEGCFHGCSL
jgi:hypothetical protein